jgi:hypothetical protein
MGGAPANSYDSVPHSHVVAAGYLRAWAHGKQIAMRRPGTTQSMLVGVKDAGVRTNFYRRARPETGETIYDVEWSLQVTETAALPVIADLRARWPLAREDRDKLGQFLALQHVRGEAFRRWHERRVESVLDRARANPNEALIADPTRTSEQTLGQLTSALTSDTYRLIKMLKDARSVATVFCSMQWALLEVTPGSLVTSDHPVIIWPLTRAKRRVPAGNDLDIGVLNTLEVFAPLSPSLVLLMTWRDRQTLRAPLAAADHHAATVNAFVIANAEDQWFHEPGATPRVARGPRVALSPQLIPGYSASDAAASRRRALARELANTEAQSPVGNQPLQGVNEDQLPT